MALVVLVAIVAAEAVALIRYRNAQHMLAAIRTVKVGATTGSEALAIGKRFSARTYVIKHTEFPSGFSDEVVDVSERDCISGNCTINFRADAKGMEILSDPLLRWDALRRWIPVNGIGTSLEIEHGIVVELEVGEASLQEENDNRARSVITSRAIEPPWNIRRYTAHISGGPGRLARTVELKFNPVSRHPNQAAALDFNLKCLRLGRSCSPCEILPGVCEDDEHGDWFYFEMPPTLLGDSRVAVNHLQLGSTEDHVVRVIGWGGITSQQLFEDRLPYRFPEDAMSGGRDPESLIYYLKKRRQYEEHDSPNDQTVMFVFDKQERLVRIVSNTDGIRSIP